VWKRGLEEDAQIWVALFYFMRCSAEKKEKERRCVAQRHPCP